MRCITVLALAAILAGCAGTNFSFDQARRVKVGMTSAQLTELMGRPYSVISKNGAEVWVWSRANGFTGSSRAVSFTVRNGIVEAVPDIPDSFGGSKQQIANGARVLPAPAPSASVAPSSSSPAQPLDKKAWQDQQIQKLQESDVSYEEYQVRYKKVMGE